MHVPDGFLDAPTSIATGVVAIGGVALALRGARRELDDRTAPMAGLVATFVFAGQMMNFPVAAGTSGHLLGGAMAAVLAGPWTAVLCISTVLLVQGLFMADGGITALGTNITLMALVGVGVGWLVFKAVRAVLPNRLGSVAPAAALGALISVPVAASRLHAALRRRRDRPRGHRQGVHRDGLLARGHRRGRSGHHLPRGRLGGRRTPRPRVRRPPGPARPDAGDPATGQDAGRRHDRHPQVLRLLPARGPPRRRRRELLRQLPPRRSELRRREDRVHRQARRPSPTSDGPFAGYSTKGIDDTIASAAASPGSPAACWCSASPSGVFWVVRRRDTDHDQPEQAAPTTSGV